MSKPIVAIVGRPNVGKSTLFNKLVGRRISIVEDTPGVTRDRIYAPCEWSGHAFLLADTGGLDIQTEDVFVSNIREQAELAIDTADVIVFVVDLRSGLTAQDGEIADLLRRSRRPVVLCVNKVDSIGELPPDVYEFYQLGLGDPYPVSSVHGHGTGDLLDRVATLLPQADEEEDKDVIHVAVIGKPNAGKSSLVNQIIGESRMLVSDIPGTTRDAVDSQIENEYGKYTFVDTAGIRRHSKVEDAVERYSVMRAFSAVERSEVCMMLIDATVGFTDQDSKIAGYAHEQGKASIIIVNKWDLIDKSTKTMDNFKKKLENDFSFMSYAPMLFISAKTGKNVNKLFKLINDVHASYGKRISTGQLNDVLSDATARVQPPTDKGKRLKILYITQPATCPPTFVVFVNRSALFHFSYQRYLENQIRNTFGLVGTPVRFIVRERDRETTT
ncbi:MAG TPA: ribosome biogenesis GTPase Der [Ruminococcaceae bacterium]|nr:ribosome biogenesis GTPase Der [Oscillospiraceae bacterium]